jgi:hypothetical protein
MNTIDLVKANRTTFNLFIKLASYTSIVVFLVQLFRANNRSEKIDQFIFLSCIIISFLFMVQEFKSKKNFKITRLSLLGLLIFIIGIFGVEKHSQINGVDLNKILWLGFGPFILLTILLIMPFVFYIYSWKNLNRTIKIIFNFLAIGVVMLVIPATWQGGNSIIDNYHSEYLINENLAVAAGHIPYVDFIPQYGTLYSWLLAPFKNYFDADGLVTVSLYMMSVGTIFALAIGVWLVYAAMNKKSLALAVLLVIPLTSVSQFPGRNSFTGTIYALLSAIPTRIMPGVFVGLLLINSLLNANKTKNMIIYIFVVPTILGLNLWNSQDFSIALVVSVFILIFFSTKINFTKILLMSISFVFGFLLYPIFLNLINQQIQWNWYGLFLQNFGKSSNAVGSEPFTTPGPVFIILPLVISLVFASFVILIKSKYSGLSLSEIQRRAILTSSLFSLWTLFGFAYYLNRSYASGQMQILFLPLSIASATFFAYLFDSGFPTWAPKDYFKKDKWNKMNFSESFGYLLIGIITTLPIASLIAMPSPQIELNRLLKPHAENSWPKPANMEAFKLITDELVNSEGAYYFGSSANYVELKYKLKSIMLFNDPYDLLQGENVIKIQCDYINKLNPKSLFMNDTGISISQAFESKIICNKPASSSDITTRLIIFTK